MGQHDNQPPLGSGTATTPAAAPRPLGKTGLYMALLPFLGLVLGIAIQPG
jgi:hypothetical protein